MVQSNPILTDCSAARIMQPGLYLKGASLSILALCWENSIGFPWSIGSLIRFCFSPTRNWMAMLHNIWQHWYQNMYLHGPSVRRIDISSIHQDGGLKHLANELSPRQPRPFRTLYPSEWSNLHLLTLWRPDLKLTCSIKHFNRLY